MTFETFFNDYWQIMLVAFLLSTFIIVIFIWIKKKKKNQNSKIKASKEINQIIIEIRKELRSEHKRLTTLFKDLDDFLAQLPAYFKEKEIEKKSFKKLNDYSEE